MKSVKLCLILHCWIFLGSEVFKLLVGGIYYSVSLTSWLSPVWAQILSFFSNQTRCKLRIHCVVLTDSLIKQEFLHSMSLNKNDFGNNDIQTFELWSAEKRKKLGLSHRGSKIGWHHQGLPYLGFCWMLASNVVWMPSFFKISSLCSSEEKKCIQGWNIMRMSKRSD